MKHAPKKFTFILMILFLSCSGKREKGEIDGIIGSEPPSLDPALATDSVSYLILNNIMEGLTKFDENMNLLPGLAERWETVDGGKKFIFHLRDAKWSDGKEITADDFLYGWKRLLNPQTGAEYAYFLYPIKGAMDFNMGRGSEIGVRVIDKKTLLVELEEPIVFFPAMVAFMSTYPQREDLVEKYGERWLYPPHGAYSGPFILKRWKRDYSVELEGNPFYYKPVSKKVKLFVVSDVSSAISLYKKKFIDYMGIPSFLISHLRNGVFKDEIFSFPAFRGSYVGFNTKKEPFDSPLVRKAFAMAIDKEELVKVIGSGIPTNSWIPPGMFGHNPSIGLKFDPAKAKELLKEYGKEIKEVSLYYNYTPENSLIAQNLQEQWMRNLGIKVKLEAMEWKAFLQTIKLSPPPLYRLGWAADYPDPDNFMTLFTSTSGNNHTEWKSERFDELVRLARSEKNPSKRKSLYDEAQKILVEEDLPIIPLFFNTNNYLVNPCLKNFNPGALDIISFAFINKEC